MRLPLLLRRLAAGLLLMPPISGASLHAQAFAGPQPVEGGRLPADAAKVPFTVGERLDYELKFGSIKVGNGSMEVKEIAELRGKTTWHTVFRITGGFALYRVNDLNESWFDVVSLTSLRFYQDIDEGNYERKRRFEIYPEREMLRDGEKREEPSVAQPLDEGSFLYFVRTIPLEVGQSYEFDRYFKKDGNPVRIRVLRRETVTVPAGTFKTVVLQPTFQTKGIFSQNGKAEVWITDDERRIMVQMKSKLSIGSLNLYLKSAAGTK